jgi:pimeloyl-ACP methyl ester carboxylesterase
MHKVEIRPGIWIAYEDDWFGKPWSVPETVVMVHGNSESSRAWVSWVTHLADKYRVVRLDLPGFGASSEPPGYGWSAGELAADVARFLDVLKIQTCHLMGAKYGGSVCMQLASEYPHRVNSLCLFGSPVRGSGSANADSIRTKGVRQWAAETMRARLGSSASAAQVRWWTEELMGKANPRAALGASSARIDMELEDRLARITAPTLIVTTKESGLQSVEAVERYAARIPSARVIVLPGDSFHIAAVEPDVCAQHALRFMAEVSQHTNRPLGRGKPDEAARERTTIEDRPCIPGYRWIRGRRGIAYAPRFRRRLLQRPGGRRGDVADRYRARHLPGPTGPDRGSVPAGRRRRPDRAPAVTAPPAQPRPAFRGREPRRCSGTDRDRRGGEIRSRRSRAADDHRILARHRTPYRRAVEL